MKKIKLSFNSLIYFGLVVCPLLIFSCSSNDKSDDEDAKVVSQTPVTVTQIADTILADYIDLNATSVTLQKNYVKSNANGYLQETNLLPGQNVTKGELLFTIKTKEAQSIGNSIAKLDTSFKFSGLNKIKATQSGYISQLSHHAGDYIADGDPLAVISDRSSFVFIMQLPYELKRYVKTGQNVKLTLPGGKAINGLVKSFMPTVDTVAQTQGVVIKINNTDQIPENLVAKARIIKASKNHAFTLPKAAILANETQTEFWVMKLINATTAVKVVIKEGIISDEQVEILSPKFTSNDKIILTGNYGLPDTAKIKIVAP